MAKVIKRDGRRVDYDEGKIKWAITQAFLDIDGEITESTNDKINTIVEAVSKINKEMSVEDIQDIVEKKLMATDRKDVAKQYVLYRAERTRERDRKSHFRKQLKEKLSASNVQNQNANIDEHSFGGRIGEATDVLLKQLALDEYVSEMARNNHINNEIYIHDLNSYVVGMHNCCDRSTKFITKDGVYSFDDFEDGDLVEVLTHDGSWQNAIVHSYGIQKLNKITFARSGQRYVEEYFTPNHRWLLSNGETTTSLKVGDTIMKAPQLPKFNFDNATPIEKYYWCLGFVLGDGTNAYRWSHGKKDENTKFVRLRLCGEKTKYHDRFNNLKHSTKLMDNGDLYLTFSSVIGFIKEFPDLEKMTWYQKLALFDGLYCADGQQKGHRKSLFTSNEQIASFIEDIVPSLGYYIIGINDYSGKQTNYGIRDFAKEFIFVGDNNKYYWTVIDIEPYKNDIVWCLDVVCNHSFVLPNGIVTGNCLTIPFDDLLAKGFNTRQTDVRPANSINTACQLTAVIFQLQSLMQFGGVSAGRYDWTLVPYVRKSFYKHYNDVSETLKAKPFNWNNEKIINTSIDDKQYIGKHSWNFIKKYIYKIAIKRTTKELEQAIEGLYHNLNTLQSRSGNQLPFTSINYGSCTLIEGRMVIKALLEGSIKGVGKFHKTSIFPCGIFQVGEGINKHKGDPNYDLYRLALKSTAQRLYPNYANLDWSVNDGYDKNDTRTYMGTMGCRTYNGYDINGLGQQKDGRGNICPVTIILPTIAMEALNEWNGVEEQRYDIEITDDMTLVDYFLQFLDIKISEAKDMLIERFDWICEQSPESAKFMYENGLMAGYIPEEGIRSALKHGTLALGQLGLAECLQILIGCDHTEEKGINVAKQIEGLFKQRCSEFKNNYHLNIGVYYSPSENLCYTALLKFRDKYGIIPNVSDNEFFTNSDHVPVWKDVTPIEKIDIEAQLAGYSNAGCITYVELAGAVKNNIDALETLVTYAMDKDIPYFAINVPNDMCNDCGYTDELNDTCPMCGSKDIRRLRRVTGYLTGDYRTAFNKGKQQEVEMRVKHQRF